MNIRSIVAGGPWFRRLFRLSFAIAGLVLLISSAARAEQAAVDVVRQYQAALLGAMKLGNAGYDARYKALLQPVSKAFDLGFLAQRAAGPAWSGFTADQRKRYVAAFTRYSVAQHASRFKSFGGERFESLGSDDVGRGYVRVRTVLVTGDGERIALDYLMGQRGGAWRIVDVFAKGTISEVATKRSEFAPVLRDSGVEGLIRALDAKTAEAGRP
ncbi:MAG: ABC transporter substrate-binding protein [Rhodospirillaceae bacterium]|nr:ABC transporter substrate-binding protein [Rhodospirillaceae bacterium]